jgi:branched-chain amino acid transport system substrate-binding protein
LRRRLPLAAALVLLAQLGVAVWASGIGRAPALEPIRIGALFPLSGDAASLAGEQLRGVRIAVDLINADGGVAGHPVELDIRDFRSTADAPDVVRSLKSAGAVAVIGAYSSDLSVAASEATDATGLVYWEAGAVADRLTARGLPLVFRVGASGSNLGASSATFAVSALAPRLDREASALRVAVVNADDDYARSVSDAAISTTESLGAPVVTRVTYDLGHPDWSSVMRALKQSAPDVVMLASHIPDGIEFRQAMVDAGVHVGALIGTTMAQCDPDFAGELGPAAVGVFASDRPTGGFRPSVLAPAARALYDRLATAWISGQGQLAGPTGSGAGANTDEGSEYGGGSGGDPEYTITGPVEAGSDAAGPTEEGLSGFTSAWVLFHDVLLKASSSGALTSESIASAARTLDLHAGSLPNGAGVRFSTDPATLGQNERAAAVIWQWQAVRSYTFVWPPSYATGSIGFVPLP